MPQGPWPISNGLKVFRVANPLMETTSVSPCIFGMPSVSGGGFLALSVSICKGQLLFSALLGASRKASLFFPAVNEDLGVQQHHENVDVRSSTQSRVLR